MKFKVVYSRENLGEKYPFGYGIAYYDYAAQSAFLYPIPFNWIIKLARDLYFFLREPADGIKEKAWKEGYQAGVGDTWRIRKEDVDKQVIKEAVENSKIELLKQLVESKLEIWTK